MELRLPCLFYIKQTRSMIEMDCIFIGITLKQMRISSKSPVLLVYMRALINGVNLTILLYLLMMVKILTADVFCRDQLAQVALIPVRTTNTKKAPKPTT